MSVLHRLIGHAERYVGVVDLDVMKWRPPCAHGKQFLDHCDVCKGSVQIARWVCDCGVAGETYIKRGTGIFTVQFGKLVPDEKRWANV